jgi:hypothetical protein
VGSMMKDLEVLYGAYGLHAHFEAFMASWNIEKGEEGRTHRIYKRDVGFRSE